MGTRIGPASGTREVIAIEVNRNPAELDESSRTERIEDAASIVDRISGVGKRKRYRVTLCSFMKLRKDPRTSLKISKRTLDDRHVIRETMIAEMSVCVGRRRYNDRKLEKGRFCERNAERVGLSSDEGG